MLYPLKFQPHFLEKIWGGSRLSGFMDRPVDRQVGESWLISGLEGKESVVSNGFLAGNTLSELLEVYLGDLAGEKVFGNHGKNFPLLVKLIDAADPLSIQVHPGPISGGNVAEGQSKAEMWYVLDAAPGAEIIAGFYRDTSQDEFIEMMSKGRLPELLQVEKVKPGDVFYIPPGQIHAIGGGVLLCEIQQASDATFRVYDYDRKDSEGNPRPLHLAQAMEALDWKARVLRSEYRETLNEAVELVRCPHFTTRLIHFDRELAHDYMFLESFVVYVCLEGSCTLEYQGGSESLCKGETVLIPAAIHSLVMRPQGSCRLLETYCS